MSRDFIEQVEAIRLRNLHEPLPPAGADEDFWEPRERSFCDRCMDDYGLKESDFH